MALLKELGTAIRRNSLATWGAVFILVLLLCAVAAPRLAPYDPNAQDLPARLEGPGSSHFLGSDELGRDILSRIIFGAQISFCVGTSVVLLSLTAGLIIGCLAGYYRGFLDRFFNVIVIQSFQAFPGILLAIALVAFLGPGLWKLVLALSIGSWIGYARLVRGQVLKVREMDYIEAERALGASDARIVIRHILPNIIQPVIVQAAIGMAGAILAEATLSFLGLGVPPPTPSWGAMLNDGRSHLFDAPHLVVFPALAVMFAVLSFNFLGDGMRDYLDPHARPEVR
jgi:peptide/nickel transport system permease protein